MASVLVYATVKGCQKYQSKISEFSAGNGKSFRKNRKSISRLVIPSLASAAIIPGGDSSEETGPPRYEPSAETELSEKLPHTSESPAISAAPPPVMIGITLCESPSTPPGGFEGFFHTESKSRSGEEENCPVYRLSQAFDQAGEEDMEEATSPAPLHVVKRSASPLPLLEEEPEMTYSSEEDEQTEGRKETSKRSSYLEVPESADERLSFEPPPIPPKSPARNSRVF